ncbi:MAG: PHP domain-containing protein [Clostridia bacterium]|nr:PHP domain-containing protein [Clostridia bacterium]
MKYIVDNDLHIHSKLSLCSNDPEQTTERILKYAIDNGIKTICLADHFWDETVEGASDWYEKQNFAHISQAKPLPQAEGVRFLFGCETELNRFLTLGVSKERFDEFDFIVIPTTHFHMRGYTIYEEDAASLQGRVKAWYEHFEAVLNMDLPFHKVGIAHLVCSLMSPKEGYVDMLKLLDESEMTRLFTKAAKLGVGIELNKSDMSFTDENAELVLRPFKIAKACGCKFYCGSDAHHPAGLDSAKAVFERAVDLLGLTEDDKFVIA